MRGKMKARRLIAALFLLSAFFELGSHMFLTSSSGGKASAWMWCAKFHNPNNGISCPHKRDHRGPERNVLDEMSHHAALLTQDDLEITVIVYHTEIPAPRRVHAISRTLTPRFQPPEQG